MQIRNANEKPAPFKAKFGCYISLDILTLSESYGTERPDYFESSASYIRRPALGARKPDMDGRGPSNDGWSTV